MMRWKRNSNRMNEFFPREQQLSVGCFISVINGDKNGRYYKREMDDDGKNRKRMN
jgi:hypothetical protein